jgi:ABC-type antimicrobial peptide transport system permease subunit
MGVVEVLVLISSFSFFSYGVAFFTSSKMKEEFIRFGLAKFGTLTAVLEILGALGLLIGLAFTPLLVRRRTFSIDVAGCGRKDTDQRFLAGDRACLLIFCAECVPFLFGDNLTVSRPAGDSKTSSFFERIYETTLFLVG